MSINQLKKKKLKQDQIGKSLSRKTKMTHIHGTILLDGLQRGVVVQSLLRAMHKESSLQKNQKVKR